MGTYEIDGKQSPLSKSVEEGVNDPASNGTFEMMGDQSSLSRTPSKPWDNQPSNGTFEMMQDMSPLNRSPQVGGAWGLPSESSTGGKK